MPQRDHTAPFFTSKRSCPMPKRVKLDSSNAGNSCKVRKTNSNNISDNNSNNGDEPWESSTCSAPKLLPQTFTFMKDQWIIEAILNLLSSPLGIGRIRGCATDAPPPCVRGVEDSRGTFDMLWIGIDTGGMASTRSTFSKSSTLFKIVISSMHSRSNIAAQPLLDAQMHAR
ncbi:MAG: hypothetical protein J3Q66DRAFT_391812 [Benniella sp.]|nr:MAG: hypothetical protein J3Q66DRAFT_391812 [Benniella sp.]